MNNRKTIRTFFISVIVSSAIAELFICKYQFMWAYPLLMWMPAVAAMIASLVSLRDAGESFTFKKLFVKTGIHFCKVRYILAGMAFHQTYKADTRKGVAVEYIANSTPA